MIPDVVSKQVESLSVAAPFPHLSWTSISLYNQCPRRFQYQYVERAPAERVSASLLFGSGFHQAVLMGIHRARRIGLAIPNEEALLAHFESGWEEAGEGRPEVVFAKGEDRAVHREMARRMLEAYRTHLEQALAPAEVVAVETEVRFRWLDDLPPLLARLDLVERRGDEVLITDLKTSRCRWKEAKEREHASQLILYALAARQMPKLGESGRLRVKFTVVTKGKRPAVQDLEPELNDEVTSRLADLLIETWSGIQAGAFPRREGWACTACPYRVRCLGR